MRSLRALVLGLAPVFSGCAGEAPRDRVRVVLITFDTLRYDHLPVVGDDFRDWPYAMRRTLDFVDGGVVFENAYSTTSTTQPTHATMFTGLQPWVHGVTRNGVVLDESHVTLAEELRAAGFETHAIVASFPLHEMFGYAQGFDTFDDDFDEPYVTTWEGQRTESEGVLLAGRVGHRARDRGPRPRRGQKAVLLVPLLRSA